MLRQAYITSLNEHAQIIKANSGTNISVEVIGARRDNPKCDSGSTKNS